ncbi:hypothetical protein SAMN05444007_11111 [Cribrihabitans marinus]|uniref:DUF6473 domain-containing protein n=1 Tax=Cribrihabitans marinus TaxID=1227549 RepID=A0A1H7DDM5_9RHOB|nr:DUF6473 family protein [Cribrihabitans marinus]GGH38607.1 hypothetical protein GCM10010973_33950 [Cribrihabitans marinus]SEJ99901.1 hypothetical protein SAMN05444007_11111 [Cribrihabitans marinus]
MSFQLHGAGAPVDPTCRYGASRLRFRGPKRRLRDPYVACLGGAETFGRFVADPYPQLLEQRLGMACVNFGSVQCGLDAMLGDPDLLGLARAAERCILQLPCAQNLSNRFYRVHPRRNDRFLTASENLVALYPEVDFTEFHFTRHLMLRLFQHSPDRFAAVMAELQRAWVARMRRLLSAVDRPTVLLWLRQEPPSDAVAPLGAAPLLVDRDMVAALAGGSAATVELAVRGAVDSDELDDMIFGALQEPAAAQMLGPATHRSIAGQLLGVLRDLE